MNKKTILIASALFGVVAAGSAFAFGGPGPGDCPQGMENGRAMQGGQGMPGMHGKSGGVLMAAYHVDNLTADQRKQLDALRDKQRDQREAMRDGRQALQEALDKGADANTVRPLAEKEGKQLTEMIMQQVELRSQVDKILTEAQRAQLKELAANPPRERAPRRGNR